MRPHRALASALVLVLAFAIAGCGDGGDEQEAGTMDHGVTVSGGSDAKPQITVPDQAPPDGLVIEDLVVGDGAEAVEGAQVDVHYVGVAWSSGEQFDSSWDRGESIEFPLAGLIPGWQEGIPGMREGGRRLLVIPPELAYGDNPPPDSGIEAGDTLVFVVDLLAVTE